jgi:tRNA modification GTPase
MLPNDTIIALATPPGKGAIAIIRLSGPEAIQLASQRFASVRGKELARQKSHTLHLGHIVEGAKVLDEVLVSLFKGPHSYTGEDVIEISCHGSQFIQQQIIQLFLRDGCRMAQQGEFTLRAFLNAKMDLSQAEAVADLIASENAASHQLALQQMRGGFSNEIKTLRAELLNFASLLELELDFSEEDVEFADRAAFTALLHKMEGLLKSLIDSFAVGNVIKNGIPIAIVGQPNVGKSTLLNALLKEERAIVSNIAGTTRDAIEDDMTIEGIGFRFIDTAGIRETTDTIEEIGIKKTFEKIETAHVVLLLLDGEALEKEEHRLPMAIQTMEQIKENQPNKPLVPILNKMDLVSPETFHRLEHHFPDAVPMTAKSGEGLDALKSKLLAFVNTGALNSGNAIVANTRHYDALTKAYAEIQKVRLGLAEGVSSDLLAIDIREALYHLGEITGQVTNDELLGHIFSNFCIGK